MAQDVTLENLRPPNRYDTVPWNRARIGESDVEAGGSWTVVDTITLDPLDDDPTDPALRSFTFEGTAPYLWYRVEFLTASNGVSLPSTPIQNAAPVSTAFASVDEFQARLRPATPLTDEERDDAATLLALASDVIRDETRLTLDLSTSTYTRPGTTDVRIPLPERPVVSVASVSVNGTAVEGWYVSGNELVRGGSSSLFDRLFESGGSFGYEGDTLEVVYTHGFADSSGIVKQTALEMCVRVWVNPGSVVQSADGSEEATYAPYADPPRGLMLTKAELGALRRKFGMQGRSLTIGGG